MKKLYKEHLEELFNLIRQYEQQHPNADVFYDVERGMIQIMYPLPKDYFKLKSFRVDLDKAGE